MDPESSFNYDNLTTMADKITPSDPRIERKSALLNGITYSYLLSLPKGPIQDTIFLIHGWPDLSLGWRYQIPLLTSLGLRVVVPDMMGYGETEAPQDLSYYTYKRAADDVAELARQLGAPNIILGGHDWGGAIVYRIAIRYPDLIKAVVSVCTPFSAPQREYIPSTVLPNFKYQLQLKGPEVEEKIIGEAKIRQFLNGMFGGAGKGGEKPFSASHGVYFENLDKLQPTPLLSAEELDYYAKQYARNGLRGPLNWYRTGELNFEDEKEIARSFEGYTFQMPVLFVAGSRDAALPPRLSEGMDKWFRNLTRGEVDANHWALWETPVEVNRYIKDFLGAQLGLGRASL